MRRVAAELLGQDKSPGGAGAAPRALRAREGPDRCATPSPPRSACGRPSRRARRPPSEGSECAGTPPFGDAVTLKPDEFRLLRDLFAARTGLHFGPESRFTLERRLRERLTVLKLPSFAEYHHYLRFGTQAAAEWDEAIDLLTTNETYFFREERQLRAFQNEVLPMLRDAGSSRGAASRCGARGARPARRPTRIAVLLHSSRLFPRDGPGDDALGRAGLRLRHLAPVRRRGASRGLRRERLPRDAADDVRRAFFQQRAGGWHVVGDASARCATSAR